MFMFVSKKLIGRKALGDVYDDDGNIIVNKGSILTAEDIEYLDNEGFSSIEVMATREELNEETMNLIDEEVVIAGGTPEVQHIVELIKHALNVNAELFTILGDVNDYDEYTCEHSIRVGIAMGCTYTGLCRTEDEVKDAILAGLMHDVGKINVNKGIITAPRKLSSAEFEQVTKHPTYSYQRIENKIASKTIKEAVLYHHVNADNSGYPEHYNVNEMTEMQHILHICDIIDARLHKRCYRDAEKALKIIRDLQHNVGYEVEPAALHAVIRHVPIFYIGDIIVLSDETICSVINYNGKYRFDRLVVKVLKAGKDKKARKGSILHCNEKLLDNIKGQLLPSEYIAS